MSKIKQHLGDSQDEDKFLDDTYRVKQRTITSTPYIMGAIRQIFDDQLLACKLQEQEIFTKKKQRHLVDARHVLYYMCSKRPMNLSYIQMYMGENGYDICHSAIIHGIKKVTAQIEKDSDYKGLVSDLNNQL